VIAAINSLSLNPRYASVPGRTDGTAVGAKRPLFLVSIIVLVIAVMMAVSMTQLRKDGNV
jgi:hypothetical protein